MCDNGLRRDKLKKKLKRKREKNRTSKLLLVLGIASFVMAFALIALMIIMNIETVRVKYEEYLVIFDELEKTVAALNNKWLILIVIVLLFVLRAYTFVYPMTIVYFMSAMVFSPFHSFIINFGSTVLMCAMRYYTGMQMGEGMWNRVLRRHPYINGMVKASEDKNNNLTLFALRFFPFFPFNTVSHIYGTLDYPFARYLIISALAVTPRLISYSFIGNNVYDPLSTKFYIPLALLFVLTGISMLLLRFVLLLIPIFTQQGQGDRNKDNNENT